MRFARVLACFAVLGAAGCAGQATEVVATTQQAAPAPAAAAQTRVAVSAFDYKGTQGGDIGQGLAELLGSALLDNGGFAQADAAPGGTPAQWLVGGSVTAFEPSCSAGSEIIVSGNQACLSLSLKVTDAASGRVIRAVVVDGSSDGNAKSAPPQFARGALPAGLAAYGRTPMEQAIRSCIDKAVGAIAAGRP
jgi:curli biogenesis system outer membrane secretion channel CsgG